MANSVALVGSGLELIVGPGAGGPTVTDANLVLQTLNPDTLPGGGSRQRQDAARAAIGALAETLGADMPATAQAILSAVTATLAVAVREVSAPGGHDPRDVALVAFGGAGPLHAARLARALGIARLLVPRHPGVLGALGKLLTDRRAEFASAGTVELQADALPAIAERFGLLRHRAAMWFSEEKIPAAGRSVTRSVDLCYAGQDGVVSLPLPDGPVTAAMLDALAAAFAAAHGSAGEGGMVQLVCCRVAATGVVPRPGFQPRPDAGTDPGAACIGSRAVWLPETGGWVTCPVYDRDRLDAGNRIQGPAIVEQMDATTLILPGMTALVEPYLALILEAGA